MTLIRLVAATDLKTFTKAKTFTHTELLAITEIAPGIVVPAPGAGKILVPISRIIQSNIVSPYTTDSHWNVWIGAPATLNPIAGGTPEDYLASSGVSIRGVVSIEDSIANLSNKAIGFAPATGGSPLADGDPANWYAITVAYYEYTVPV